MVCSLVGRVTPAPATVAAAVASARGEAASAAVESTSTPETTSSAASTHSGDVGALGNDLHSVPLVDWTFE